MRSLVGYTGFVGSNLNLNGEFEGLYNSKNIGEAFGTCPDILVYSGVPRQKFIANKYPERDFEIVKNAFENIKKIKPKKVVLISSVDVYKEPNGKDEDRIMETEGLRRYGKDRLWLENKVSDSFDSLVIRLPGLYGKGLKKNFLYDYINYIPALLTDGKIRELLEKRPDLKEYYTDRGDGFWRVKTDIDRDRLKEIFKTVGFSALNFTDSRGLFQYYNLNRLNGDIQLALDSNIKVLNLAVEPVTISQIYRRLTGEEFVNHITGKPPVYDLRTKYSNLFGGKDGYILNKEFCLMDIKQFVENYTENR